MDDISYTLHEVHFARIPHDHAAEPCLETRSRGVQSLREPQTTGKK